ncbi:high-affinity iron transporter [Diplodia corticola]|uniref:High-affinity iron transporter n=1 Tax=Diplodia corticola TaxID=236234 RepID=A0A1J9R1G4_9PEZI|nr:high-affinity iron transporter [Diplodia corticola]OJD34082.1 high-affinity iron transporter [Diplodia corticola]
MTVNVFAVPVFFIVFRECLETVIVISVWLGVVLGLVICLCIGAGMIGAFYGYGKDHFASTEDIWEGVFGIVAALIISIMGAALLRVNKLQDKWRVKLTRALEPTTMSSGGGNGGGARTRLKAWAEKYAMFLLPFVTVLREGLEAVVYVGGVSLGLPATAFPLAVICGLAAGCAVGYILYRGGNSTKLQVFLIISTCFLYLVAAGLFSRAVWYFETNTWNHVIGGDASETGSGPGSYDIRQSVWHVNCCNPELNGGGGWGIFNAILGWQNSATYGSVLSYNLYWLVVIVVFVYMRYKEKHAKVAPVAEDTERAADRESSSRSEAEGVVAVSPEKSNWEVTPTTQARELKE